MKYEYKQIEGYLNELESILMPLGVEGWEVASFRYQPTPYGEMLHLLMKRASVSNEWTYDAKPEAFSAPPVQSTTTIGADTVQTPADVKSNNLIDKNITGTLPIQTPRKPGRPSKK